MDQGNKNQTILAGLQGKISESTFNKISVLNLATTTEKELRERLPQIPIATEECETIVAAFMEYVTKQIDDELVISKFILPEEGWHDFIITAIESTAGKFGTCYRWHFKLINCDIDFQTSILTGTNLNLYAQKSALAKLVIALIDGGEEVTRVSTFINRKVQGYIEHVKKDGNTYGNLVRFRKSNS